MHQALQVQVAPMQGLLHSDQPAWLQVMHFLGSSRESHLLGGALRS